MNDLRTLRFERNDFYDINEDVEKTRILAITNVGTWYTDIRADQPKATVEGVIKTREVAFKEYVINALASKLEPAEVCFGD